ncbi:MAG: helicase [Armatimonadetes bacterium]|nr:helicase [Armatimonadota bacterium]
MYNTSNAIRDELVEYLRSNLLGPVGGEDEALDVAPHQRYLMGTLYPKIADIAEPIGLIDDGEEYGTSIEEEAGALNDDEDTIRLATQWMPSSAGLSCFVVAERPELEIEVKGATYCKSATGFQRMPFHFAIRISPEDSRPHTQRKEVLDGQVGLSVTWRPYAAGHAHLATVTLVNIKERKEETRIVPEDCIFQPSISCRATSGKITDYPRFELLLPSDEDRELQLLYRRNRTFAMGHGCATYWEADGDVATEVRTSFFPVEEVKALTTDVSGLDSTVLDLAYLSGDAPDLAQRLGEFVDKYGEWIERLPAKHGDIPRALFDARDALLSRMRIACERMRRGIEVLTTDDQKLRAFQWANLAMAMQMRHSSDEYAGTRRKRNEANSSIPDYRASGPMWFPFQLAFMLLTLAGVGDADDPDRGVVDLIWFPTGGGKTEAYLLAAAYGILLDRLRNPAGARGTVVITRYTLRLLTAQQFQRSAALICALEFLRRGNEQLGSEPITIGMWVGRDSTPNTFADAYDTFRDMRSESEPKSPFPLERCPWCGTEIVPQRASEDDGDFGIRCDGGSFRFYCPTDTCVFSDILPINVVDEALYAAPPTFLVATIDKFAQFSWDERPGCFLGASGYRVPSIVIQDELHLVAGPLGTVASLYEAAFDEVLAANGARVKIIASTATIRNADDQVRGLFARPVQVFPPAGLSCDDAFFSKTDESKPGRLYCGFMPPGHSSTTAQLTLTALIAQFPMESKLAAGSDDYWTQVIYHNSLREHGKTTTLLRDDVPGRIDYIAQGEKRLIDDDNIVELTSNTEDEMTDLLARLGRPKDVSVVSCTNMLSVGVDVKRLAVMTIVGQPKATAEYIQASSRVGRSNVPGVVIALYRPLKPRDRSHYESFRSYHESLYRYVEPTSVTPFSLPARQRALHAALVVLVRHAAGLSANGDASRFRKADEHVHSAIEALKNRSFVVDHLESTATSEHLDKLADNWEHEALEFGNSLKYSTKAAGGHSLLRNFDTGGSDDATQPPWPTLQSMRNVDSDSNVLIQGER